MTKNSALQLTLDQPAKYRIKVPGKLNPTWLDSAQNMTMSFDLDQDGMPISTIRGVFDQSALQGFLRHLYALGLPLLSVLYLGVESDKETDRSGANEL
jgi:hypothetical protein